MKQLIFLQAFLFLTGALFAQNENSTQFSKREQRRQQINALVRQEEEGIIAYQKHTIFGIKLNEDGYGGFLEVGRGQSVKKSLLFQLEITERKHPKEEKQQISYSTTPLIYGKINFFYPVKLGVQQQILLGNKGNKNGVSISGNFGGGIVLGLLRPYLVDVQKDNGVRSYVGYESADSYYFLNGPYYGGPGMGTGWSQLKVTPGIHLKSAVRFDYGKYNEMVNAIEAGVMGEFYAKKIPQMIYNKDKQLFFSLYVSILFGRRK